MKLFQISIIDLGSLSPFYISDISHNIREQNCPDQHRIAMAEDFMGDQLEVDKILDKRTRNGKTEYYLSWKV